MRIGTVEIQGRAALAPKSTDEWEADDEED